LENDDSNRRRFFHKILRLGAVGGIAALLFDRLTEKTIVPPAQAAGLNIDTVNTGSGTTELRSSLSPIAPGSAFKGYATAATGDTYGVWGQSDSTSGIGVYGRASAGTGPTYGVHGQSDSIAGIGVEGIATATTGSATGVWGTSISTEGVGVMGMAIGVRGVGVHASGLKAGLIVDGLAGIGTSSPARQLHVRGNQAVSRMDRDVDSAAFIFVRTAPGNFNTVWKSFMFGADASGVNNGRFVIGDLGTAVSGTSVKRLVIDNTGRVGIGTESPAELLHVAGNVKASGFITGDMKFANNYIVTEDEREGLAFKNEAGEKIAVLDRQGNFHIKGRFISDL